ncbi:uncharacterized protein A4U43_UnF8700 [Asparagus officinalis]|uniref:Uncharacterized protein n=1 Tax=Asparagus officinalis TaxID=4686 RepID=A0A1R3L5W5_ASPOF|nr:uncharacterized protein A4U43_UnF8700 [Asparagus officinalis]
MNTQHSDHQIDVDVDIDLNNATPLHTAASLGLTELTRNINHRNPELALCNDDRGGITPLHVALMTCGRHAGDAGDERWSVANERVRVLEAMVRDEGELFGCMDKEGNNVLHLAAARKQVEKTLGVGKQSEQTPSYSPCGRHVIVLRLSYLTP